MLKIQKQIYNEMTSYVDTDQDARALKYQTLPQMREMYDFFASKRADDYYIHENVDECEIPKGTSMMVFKFLPHPTRHFVILSKPLTLTMVGMKGDRMECDDKVGNRHVMNLEDKLLLIKKSNFLTREMVENIFRLCQ